VFGADVRKAGVDALYDVQPCPSLLQPASQLWQFLQTLPKGTLPEQTLPQQTMPQLAITQPTLAPQTLAQQTLAQQTLALTPSVPQHNLPQPGTPSQQTLDQQVSLEHAPNQAGAQGIKEGAMLPPLPESQVSSLRQRARLASLHLADEEEGGRTDFGTGREDEEGMGAAVEEEDSVPAIDGCAHVIPVPAELQVGS